MPRKQTECRSDLIEAAQELFFQKGYENTSVNDIIAEVGVSKGAFYHYFESKIDLLHAVMVNFQIAYQQSYQHILEDDTLNPIEKWQQSISIVGDMKIERKAEFLRMAEVLMRDENVLIRQKLREHKAESARPFMIAIINQGVAQGMFTVEHIEETADIVYAITHAFSSGISRVLMYPESHDDPVNLIRRKVQATETAMERILGLAPGTLHILNKDWLLSWLER